MVQNERGGERQEGEGCAKRYSTRNASASIFSFDLILFQLLEFGNTPL